MEKLHWLFDQEMNVAAISDKYVIDENYPILLVIHYNDDNSWGFLSGLTDDEKDGRVLSMKECYNLDNTIMEIAYLPPGKKAIRKNINENWSVE